MPRKSFPPLLRFLVSASVVVFTSYSSLSQISAIQIPAQSDTVAPPPSPAYPLIVNDASHVVVIEYEAWFGPNAVTFQSSPAMPYLQSADMQSVGGGYDSADPLVIQQHVRWMEYMGVDAATIDLTNNVSCIFNSEWFVNKYLKNFNGCNTWRTDYQNIRGNTGNLYPAWSGLKTRLKLIPLLGGIDANVLFLDIDGKTAFEKEINYFGQLMWQYPDLCVIYQGKPLLLIYLGAAQDPNPSNNPLWFRIRKFLERHPEIESKYTFKMVAGYLDSQPDLWATHGTPDGPIGINSEYSFWSVGDRLNPFCTDPLCPYYPTYNKVSDRDSRVENFTVSIATAGQSGWDCPATNSPPCSDDGLRFGDDHSYMTFGSFMRYARRLDPIFLIVDQFNEFVPPDEGPEANTDDDIEPSNQWGFGALDVVKQEIESYHAREERKECAQSLSDECPN